MTHKCLPRSLLGCYWIFTWRHSYTTDEFIDHMAWWLFTVRHVEADHGSLRRSSFRLHCEQAEEGLVVVSRVEGQAGTLAVTWRKYICLTFCLFISLKTLPYSTDPSSTVALVSVPSHRRVHIVKEVKAALSTRHPSARVSGVSLFSGSASPVLLLITHWFRSSHLLQDSPVYSSGLVSVSSWISPNTCISKPITPQLFFHTQIIFMVSLVGCAVNPASHAQRLDSFLQREFVVWGLMAFTAFSPCRILLGFHDVLSQGSVPQQWQSFPWSTVCNESARPLWPPDLEAELETLCLGASRRFNSFVLKNVWCWGHGVLDGQGHCPISKEV